MALTPDQPNEIFLEHVVPKHEQVANNFYANAQKKHA
jgi:hypothetical protein